MEMSDRMKKCLDSGKVPTSQTDPIGNMWAKAKNKDADLKAAYEREGKSYAAQLAFRIRWLKTEWDAKETSKVHTRNSSKEEVVEEEDCGALKIYGREGRGRHGLYRTLSWLWKCIRLGGRMITWNSDKSSLEFIFVNEKNRRGFHEAWSIIESQTSGKGTKKPIEKEDSVAPSVAIEEKKAIEEQKAIEENTAIEEKKARITKVAVSDAEKLAKKEKLQKVRCAVETAAGALQRHQEVVGQYQTTLQTVAEDPLWGWCKLDESFTKAMKTAYKQVTTLKQKDVFYGALLTKEHEEWKKSYAKDMSLLVEAVEEKVPALQQVVEALSDQITTLVAMHYARPEIVKLGLGGPQKPKAGAKA